MWQKAIIRRKPATVLMHMMPGMMGTVMPAARQLWTKAVYTPASKNIWVIYLVLGGGWWAIGCRLDT